MRFSDRIVLVTGGATGIGAAIVRRFADEGASVAICGLEEGPVTAMTQVLDAAGVEAAGWIGDVGQEDDVRRIVEGVHDRFGRLDILVNCAGTSAVGKVEGMSLSTWQRVFDTNTTGVFLMSRAAIPHLRRRQGAIINIGSQLALSAVGGFAAYCASKAALVQLSRAMALELVPDRIRVNVVCPGAVDTPLLREAFPGGTGPQGTLDELVSAHPIGRLGRPEEIAGAVAYLASEDASFAVGATLVVDGGYTLP